MLSACFLYRLYSIVTWSASWWRVNKNVWTGNSTPETARRQSTALFLIFDSGPFIWGPWAHGWAQLLGQPCLSQAEEQSYIFSSTRRRTKDIFFSHGGGTSLTGFVTRWADINMIARSGNILAFLAFFQVFLHLVRHSSNKLPIPPLPPKSSKDIYLKLFVWYTRLVATQILNRNEFLSSKSEFLYLPAHSVPLEQNVTDAFSHQISPHFWMHSGHFFPFKNKQTLNILLLVQNRHAAQSS